MKISFDLDDTLIPAQKDDFETEKRNAIQKFLGIELIRKGTKEVFQTLRDAGHEVGIYTTSFRKIERIKFQLWTYGISSDFVINERLNKKRLQENLVSCSKHPPSFGIDLHIDDSKGVKMEGEKFGFEVIVVSNENLNWMQELKERIT